MTKLPDFDALLAEVSAADFACDPLPGWAGTGTLFDAPAARPGDRLDAGAWVAAGVPFDGTASSRPGAAEGQRAIRAASSIYSSALVQRESAEMLDMRTGTRFRYRPPRLFDAGNLHVYPTDTLRTFKAVAAELRELLAPGGRAIVLGGDHSVTFPAFAGYRAALRERGEGRRVGFVNVDHHFDFGEWSPLHGALYHGSNTRRISELADMRPEDVAFVGVGDVTLSKQYERLVEAGFHVVPAARIRAEGAEAIAPVVGRLLERCDGVYVSLDIDVLDASVAPGTGNVTIGGLSSAALLDVVEALQPLPLDVVDVVEVAPRYDPTGRTAQIAARVLFELLFRAESQPAAPAGRADRVGAASSGDGATGAGA